MKTDLDKLEMWRARLGKNQIQIQLEREWMDIREQTYLGNPYINRPIIRGDKSMDTGAPHIRNITAELIESEIDSSIPQPKVTAKRPEDEQKAKIIEDMIRNELDRMPFERINDLMERIVPIQGGAGFLVEWDNEQRTHYTVGDIVVTPIHPKQIVPQYGVYNIADMDYFFLVIPQTKEYIKKHYGVDVENDTEEEPYIKTSDPAMDAPDLVTMFVAFYKNDKGGIGKYSWVIDTCLEDIEDYQGRLVKKCKECGEVLPPLGSMLPIDNVDGIPIDTGKREEKDVCPFCGSTKFEEVAEDFIELATPIVRSDGSIIPGEYPEVVSQYEDEQGMVHVETEMKRTRIPQYEPRMYPLVFQKNVSVYGRFLGDSDVDKIMDQQNTTNRIEKKIIDKLVSSGSYMTLPDNASIRHDTEELKVIRPGNAADKALIDVFDMEAPIQQDIAYLAQVYEEGRQILGITDSFQGRKDTTATSGVAKEFAAAQTAGRLESKRKMKDAAYAELFELIFKFKLAYADEPRPVVSKNTSGDTVYEVFNRYDFLEQDETGEWHWNDQFLFACDTSAPLAANREAMWQETRLNLQTGAFGDPMDTRTLILFWTKMEMLHYPGAGETKQYLEDKLKEEQQMQAMMAQQQQMAQAQALHQAQADAEMADTARTVEDNARMDAQAAINARRRQ